MCKHCNRSKKDDFGIDNVRDYTKNVQKNTGKKIESLFKNKKR